MPLLMFGNQESISLLLLFFVIISIEILSYFFKNGSNLIKFAEILKYASMKPLILIERCSTFSLASVNFQASLGSC